MPGRPLKPCATPGCRELVRGSPHCAKHQVQADAKRALHMKKVHRDYNERRDSSDDFYKSQAWVRFRVAWLRENPLCSECAKYSRVKLAVIVDHIVTFKKAPERALDRTNVRSLCRACHNRVGERAGLLQGGRGG